MKALAAQQPNYAKRIYRLKLCNPLLCFITFTQFSTMCTSISVINGFFFFERKEFWAMANVFKWLLRLMLALKVSQKIHFFPFFSSFQFHGTVIKFEKNNYYKENNELMLTYSCVRFPTWNAHDCTDNKKKSCLRFYVSLCAALYSNAKAVYVTAHRSDRVYTGADFVLWWDGKLK